MDRLDDILKVMITTYLWYNFDTKEIISNDELQQRLNSGLLSYAEVSSDNQIPVYGNVERACKYWFPYMDVVLKMRDNIYPKFGKIKIRNTPPRGVKGAGYVDVPGWQKITAWSRGATPWKELSPFYIGPVNFTENGVAKQAQIFENF